MPTATTTATTSAAITAFNSLLYKHYVDVLLDFRTVRIVVVSLRRRDAGTPGHRDAWTPGRLDAWHPDDARHHGRHPPSGDVPSDAAREGHHTVCNDAPTTRGPKRQGDHEV